MDFEKSANYAVEELTKGSNFQIKVVSYDEAHFGNAEVSLTSSQNLRIRFLLDKGEKWSEIGRTDDEWFSFNDVLDVLGIIFSPNETEFIDWVGEISKFIKIHFYKFESAFEDRNYMVTHKKLKELARQRMLK
ncbi:MAG: hypothetical protein K6T85_07160 [Gorillibacterium sp.]|nr:hypothetical protein [Gorillibacterium sp.]